MRKVRKLFVMVCFSCVATSFITAQTTEITKKDVMYANRKVFELVSRYAEYSDFSKDYQKNVTWFNYLFSQNNLMTVAKDLLPWYESATDDLDMTTFKDYKAFSSSHFNELSFYEVKDARVLKTEIKGDRIDYQVEVTKVETLKKNDVTDSCKVILHISYDQASHNALITSITWSEKGTYFQPYLTAKYEVRETKNREIPKTIKTVNGVTLGSKPVVINQRDYVASVPACDIAPLILDSTVNGRERTYFMTNSKNSIGVSADYLVGIVNMEKNILTDLGNYEFKKVKASVINWHLGLNYYRQLFLSGKNRLGIDLGLMVGRYKMKFNCDSIGEQYEATDADGARYNRFVTIRDYQEHAANVSLVVPVALRYDRFINRNLSLAFCVGVKGHILIPQKSKASFKGDYAGLYPDLFNIYIDQEGYYDFGSYGECMPNLIKEKNASKTLAASVFGSFGVQYYITKIWSIDVNVMYDYLFTKALKRESGIHLSSDKEHFRSFTYFMNNLPNHNLGLNVRVKYNF